jgi:hypothetical protein
MFKIIRVLANRETLIWHSRKKADSCQFSDKGDCHVARARPVSVSQSLLTIKEGITGFVDEVHNYSFRVPDGGQSPQIQ